MSGCAQLHIFVCPITSTIRLAHSGNLRVKSLSILWSRKNSNGESNSKIGHKYIEKVCVTVKIVTYVFLAEMIGVCAEEAKMPNADFEGRLTRRKAVVNSKSN